MATSSSSSLRAFVYRYVVAFGAALVLTVAGLVGVNLGIDQKFSRIHRVKDRLTLPKGPPEAANYLLIGSDTRAFESPGNLAEQQAFGSPQTQTGQRSDTMMIVHVDPIQKKTLLVSIPRDTVVDIPGMGRQKINAAFNAGPQKVIDTIKADFEVPINHYVEVDFKAFQGVVNAIGTVPIWFPAPARDTMTGLVALGPACNHLNGQQALAYVRSRDLAYFVDGRWENASPRADLDRINRQQGFIRKLATVAFHKAEGSFFAANAIADKVVTKLTIDNAFSRGDLLRLVNAFRTVDPSNPQAVEMDTLPTKAGDAHGSFLLLDQPAADQMLQRLRTFGSLPGAPKAVHPYEVHLEVLNGSGATGIAGSTMSTLQGTYGFSPAGTGNHSHVDVTEVRYAPQALAKAQLVQSYLAGVGRLVPDPSIVQADVVLVLGRDFRGVAAPPGAPGATTSTTKAAGKKAAAAPRSPEQACT